MLICKLMDSIVTKDQALNAAKQFVRSDTGPDGKQYNYEKCAASIVPVYPIALKTAFDKSPMAYV